MSRTVIDFYREELIDIEDLHLCLQDQGEEQESRMVFYEGRMEVSGRKQDWKIKIIREGGGIIVR